MYSHWKKQHGGNPAALQLISRFKKITKNKRLTIAQLDVQAPLSLRGEDETEGHEQLRSLDDIASEDVFTYEFTMHSEGHHGWLAAAGTI